VTRTYFSFTVNFTIQGYALNKTESVDLSSRKIRQCKDKQQVINLFGCYDGFLLIPDDRPASPSIKNSSDEKLIMVNTKQTNFELLEENVSEECGKLFDTNQ